MTAPSTLPSRPRRRDTILRMALVMVVLGALGGFYFSGLYESFRWSYVRDHVSDWQHWTGANLGLAMVGFIAVYVMATALSLPIALMLSLVAGALFGRWLGPVVVILGSNGGACLAFLGSRYLFRDWVRRHFATRLERIDRGVARDGAWYLLTLRMMPVFPFFLINLGMALTPMRLSTFALVSMIGMLPATVVITNAGTELANLEKPSDALSPTFLVSLALVGLLPLLLRLCVRWITNPARVASDPVKDAASNG